LIGLLGGLVVTVGTSVAILKRAGSVRSKALPTEIHVPGSDGDGAQPPRGSSDPIQ
jgi:hypothetical protein